MSNIRIRIALNGLMGFSSFLIIFLVSRHHFWESPTKIVSAILLSACVGCAPILVKADSPQSTRAGWIASLGVKIFFSVVATLFGVIAVILGSINQPTASSIFDVVTFLSLASLFGVSRVTEEMVSGTNNRSDFKSSHLIWATQLELLAQNIEQLALREKVIDASESAKYLSRDASSSQSLENSSISGLIQNLSSAISSQDMEQAQEILARLKTLFVQRETILKSARSKA